MRNAKKKVLSNCSAKRKLTRNTAAGCMAGGVRGESKQSSRQMRRAIQRRNRGSFFGPMHWYPFNDN